MNDTTGETTRRPRTRPPSVDGYLDVELSNAPVRYHIAYCFGAEPDPAECGALARSACVVACMAADIMRGRMPPPALSRTMTGECLDRLVTMARIVEGHELTRGETRRGPYHLPAMPRWLEGMLVNPATLDMTIGLTIGRERYLANVVLKRSGGRWVCTLADIG